MSSLMTEDYLQDEARNGNRRDFDGFMGKVLDIELGKQDGV